MIVLVVDRRTKEQELHVEVEQITENDDLEIILVTPHSEDCVVDHHTHRIDVVGLG